VDLRGKLDTGETLTGAPTVAEVTTTHLTLSNKIVNVAVVSINGQTVGIGLAVQFKVAGGTAGTVYTINIRCGTSAGQTVEENVVLNVI